MTDPLENCYFRGFMGAISIVVSCSTLTYSSNLDMIAGAVVTMMAGVLLFGSSFV